MGDFPKQLWPTEVEYLKCLAIERHMFAWTLVNYGGMSSTEAEAGAMSRYPYEPPEEKYRELIFHETAWHWAMLELRGHAYWIGNRGANLAPEDYCAEDKKFRESVNAGSVDSEPDAAADSGGV